MNKKFLSTLLTVAAASLTLNAAPVAKTRAKVVEVEMAPAKMLEVKASPQRILGSGTVGLGLETGYYNYAVDLHGEWLYSGNHDLFVTEKSALTYGGWNAGIDLTYYAKENRRTGLYWTLGANFTMGTDADKVAETDTNGNYKSKDKSVTALTVNFKMGHKIEVLDFLFVSNSFELPFLVYYNDASKPEAETKGHYVSETFKANNSSSLLNSARLNLLEVRFGF